MENPKTSSHIGIAIILLSFFTVSLAYSLVVPLFNAPDENQHFEYIRFIAEKGRLPDHSFPERAASHESFNPPLYYFFNALLLKGLSGDPTPRIITPSSNEIKRFYSGGEIEINDRLNPKLNPRYIKFGGGKEKNMYLTSPNDHPPFKGSYRTIHLLRIISVILGSLTIYYLYRTAFLFFGENNPALLAASIAAFTPQFNFISGSLNNDNLVIFFSTLSLFFLTRLMVRSKMERRDLLFLGSAIGLGLISKVNISSIAAVSTLAILFKSFKTSEEGWKRVARDLASFLLPVILLSGWFFMRNVSLYGIGDPLGWKLRALQNPELLLPPELRGLFFRKVFFQRLFTSFWGHFDWLTITLPLPLYWFYGLLSLTGLFGMAALFKKGTAFQKRCLAVYLATLLLSFANLVILNFTFLSAQSRLLFPSITVFVILMGAGVTHLLKAMERRSNIDSAWTGGAFMASLFAMNFYVLAGVIYPVYH